ncbi:MAG: hypothetical protein A3B68_02685 [Candidatus Melainabacteria bacterium RIFCSPHIGHO2_02_FULL_34_12]|nr:MAG: hypothetical protein A3B68_02685 [Candidatus Melainabacteria bacterium RIFCSPHIGHO2_02_FULL_34_12]
MNIVFIAPECFPFAKVGSLADFVAMLSKDIAQEGHNIKVFIPRYGCIDPSINHIERIPSDFKITINNSQILISVYKGILPDSFVSIYFIESQNNFSNSKEIYLSDLADDERFGFFCLSTLEIISKLNIDPDIVHLFNSRTAQIVSLLKSKNIEYTGLNKTGILFTINNSSSVKGELLAKTKSAINNSDFITATSEVYAEELIRDSYKDGFSETLVQKKGQFYGINSSLDETIYNPEIDKDIAQPYSKNYFSAGKRKCKEDLLELIEFESNSQLPLFGIVTRLSTDKGSNVLVNALPQIAHLNVLLVLLCKGDSSYEMELNKLASKYKNIKVSTAFNHILSKKIYAGSDFFICPSEQNSAGESVLAAMKYGAVPIAFNAGAIKQIIKDIYINTEGNGITYNESTKEDLFEATNRALQLYKNKEKWTLLIKNAMNFDSKEFATAKKYMKCYEHILEKRTSTSVKPELPANLYQ